MEDPAAKPPFSKSASSPPDHGRQVLGEEGKKINPLEMLKTTYASNLVMIQASLLSSTQWRPRNV
jgi:hypothetical protein